MTFGGAEEGAEDGGGAASAVAAHEEIILASNHNPAKRVFREVVVDGEIAVVKVAGQGSPIVQGILHGPADGTLGRDWGLLGVKLRLHGIEQGLGFFLAQRATGFGAEFVGVALDLVEFLYPGGQGVAAQRVAGAGVVEVAAAVRRARDLDDNAVVVVRIASGVDAVAAAERVGLRIARRFLRAFGVAKELDRPYRSLRASFISPFTSIGTILGERQQDRSLEFEVYTRFAFPLHGF